MKRYFLILLICIMGFNMVSCTQGILATEPAVVPGATLQLAQFIPGKATLTPSPTQQPPTLSPANTPTTLPLAITMAEVELLSGPGDSYRIISKVAKGTKLVLTGRNNDQSWIMGQTTEATSGWIRQSRIDFPAGQMADLPIVTVVPAIRGWEYNPVNSVCLEINADMREPWAQENPGMDYIEMPNVTIQVRSFLAALGVKVVEAPDCDATLDIKLIITPLRAEYLSQETNSLLVCYSGVKVIAQTTLTSTQSHQNLTYNHSATRLTSQYVQGCPSYATSYGETSYIIWQGLRDLWGDDLFRIGFESNNTYIMDHLMNDISTVGTSRARPFIPYLIRFATGQDQKAQDAQRLLTVLTQKQFGDDGYQWQIWWNSQFTPTVSATLLAPTHKTPSP